MGTIFSPFRSLAGSFGKEVTPLEVIEHLQAQRKPIRLEIENSEVSFYTFIAIRGDTIVIAKPLDIAEEVLKNGRIVRFTVPDGSGKVVRMKILNSSLKRGRGAPVILCQQPGGFTENSKRGSERFNTSHFKNLQLIVPQSSAKFRIIDLSEHGCKTYVKDLGDTEKFTLAVPMRFAKIAVGKKLKIELDILTPRFVKIPTVKFEWIVRTVGHSPAALAHLLDSLHSKELGRLKAKEKPPKPAPGASSSESHSE